MSLIDKLKDVIEKHYSDTGERLESFDVEWEILVGSKARPADVSVRVNK